MNIDDLIARATATKGGVTCWAARVKGDPKTFTDRIHDALDAGDSVNFAEASRILTNDLGFEIGETAVRRHFSNHGRH